MGQQNKMILIWKQEYVNVWVFRLCRRLFSEQWTALVIYMLGMFNRKILHNIVMDLPYFIEYREKKLRHDKLSRQFFVSNLSNLVVILVEILVAKAIPAKKPK